MFEWWKDLFRPIRVTDRDFGEMRFLRQSSTWECRAHFAPVDDLVEVLLEGDDAGPTPAQRELWQGLAVHYPRLAEEARELIEQTVAEQEIDDFVFGLAAISLSDASAPDHDLELTFGRPSGPPQFDAPVKDWSLLGVTGPL